MGLNKKNKYKRITVFSDDSTHSEDDCASVQSDVSTDFPTISRTQLRNLLKSTINLPSDTHIQWVSPNVPRTSPHYSNISSTSPSPIASRRHSPVDWTRHYQLKPFDIALDDIGDKLHLYQPAPRKKGRCRGGSAASTSKPSRGRPRGRPRGRGRSRRTSSEGSRPKMFDNLTIPIGPDGQKIPNTVCKNLISHCTKKHPRSQDKRTYSPILYINEV